MNRREYDIITLTGYKLTVDRLNGSVILDVNYAKHLILAPEIFRNKNTDNIVIIY